MHETVPIAGTPLSLNYASDRVAGYDALNHLLIPISGASVPSSVVSISLEVDVAGRSFTASFPPSPNLSTTFDWDGQDVLGRTLQGGQMATVSVGYVYPGVYLTPSENPKGATYDALFGHYSYYGTPATADPTRQQVTLLQKTTVPLGHWDNEALGLGGWNLSVHAVYEPSVRTLHFGDGTNVVPAFVPGIIQTIENINAAGAVAVAPDGTLYVGSLYCIYRIPPGGTIQVFAGNCGGAGYGFSGDGGPAIDAQLYNVSDIAVGQDGSVYIADFTNNRIRRVNPTGTISTFAGGGNLGAGNPATQVGLGHASSVTVAPDGDIYLVDGGEFVRKVTPDGILSTVAGTGPTCCSTGTGGPAANAALNGAGQVRMAPDGSLIVSESNAYIIRRIGVDGIIRAFAGGNGSGVATGDGGPATSAGLGGPYALAISQDGTVVFTDGDSQLIRQVTPDGIIHSIAGVNGVGTFGGDNGPATDAFLRLPSGVCFGPDGTLYIGDLGNGRVRTVGAPLAGFTAPTGGFQFSSPDGSLVYSFDGNGRHLTTSDAITGATVYKFGYDSQWHVNLVTDVNGYPTTLTRDASGNPTSIVSPFVVTTALSLGSDGYLSAVQDPTGATSSMTYSTGLLSTIQFPTGSPTAQSKKTYDALGRVLSSTDAAGGTLTFRRAPDSLSNIGVTKTTSQGVATQYAITIGNGSASSWTNNLPGGLTATQQVASDSSTSVTSADGTQTSTAFAPDPRFGMLSPIPAKVTVATPSGLTSTTTMTRAVTVGGGTKPLVSLTDTTVVNGNTWTRAFSAGPPETWTTTSPVGRVTKMTVDFAGRPLQISVNATPPVSPLSFLYDSHGRLQQTTQGARTWLSGYDSNGYANSQTDPLAHTVSTLNDLDGRPLTTTLQDLREVGTSWDGDGNMLNITLPGALATQPDPTREHQFSFTPVDLTHSYTPPSIGSGLPSTTYAYDLDRFLMTTTRPDGVVVTHLPDAFERLSQITYPQGTIGYAYSPGTGQLVTTTTPGGETTTFAYDGFLQHSITWNGPVAGSIAFGYNTDFRVTSQTLNAGTALLFGYDDDGLLNLAGTLMVVPDPQNGRLSVTTLGNITDAYTYDSLGQLASYTASYSGSAVYTETIVSRDLNGRITEKTDALEETTHDWKYTYDPTGRLTEVTEDGTHVSHYGYDGDDNRISVGVTTVTTPTYDAQDRLSTYPSLNTSYAFTANGELTSKTVGSQVTSYTYDVLGNLLHVGFPAALPDGAQTVDYVVDGQNRRVGKKVNGTLLSGWLYQDQLRPVAQLDGTGTNVVARFVYGSKPNVPDYMVTSGGTYRILSDHLGSPRAVVDIASGNLIETINFDEFGNETDTLAVTLPTGYVRIPFGFGGGLYDPDTGLVRFGARDYDASVGRWTAKDRRRFRSHERNLYWYAAGDPVDLSDPRGFDVWVCYADADVPFLGAIAGAIGIKHEWIKTSSQEAGLGPAGGQSCNSCPYLTQTAVTDQSDRSMGSSGLTCYLMPTENEACVNQNLHIGEPRGPWSLGNNCNTYANDILDRCNTCPDCADAGASLPGGTGGQ